jgi:hypothetical protein
MMPRTPSVSISIAVVLLCCTAVIAADHSTKQQIHEAMIRNFDACNRENIQDVMDSCADAMPDREKFRRETLETFEDKDIHYSLVECELLEVR